MLKPDTRAVSAGRPDHQRGAPVNVPISTSSTFRTGGNVEYARDTTESVSAFEAALGAVDDGLALSYSSGLAACATIFEGLPTGSVVVAPPNAYFGVAEMLSQRAQLGRLEVRFCDITDTAATLTACDGADLLWLETPLNPSMGICDIERLTAGAHSAGVQVVCDNTFASPVCQQPLDFGVDIVMHSATKFIGGHSDLVMGATTTRDEQIHAELLARRGLYGPLPGSLTAFLALRGLRTLFVRVERAQANAAELAHRLSHHPAVTCVRYPGLVNDPGHEIAKRQMRGGFGAMLAFETVGTADTADRVCTNVRLITPATSLGGVETLIERRARYAAEAAVGTPPTLLRVAVGIENVDDLWADLDGALNAAIA